MKAYFGSVLGAIPSLRDVRPVFKQVFFSLLPSTLRIRYVIFTVFVLLNSYSQTPFDLRYLNSGIHDYFHFSHSFNLLDILFLSNDLTWTVRIFLLLWVQNVRHRNHTGEHVADWIPTTELKGNTLFERQHEMVQALTICQRLHIDSFKWFDSCGCDDEICLPKSRNTREYAVRFRRVQYLLGRGAFWRKMYAI